MAGGVYKITNLIDKKIYIGSAIDLKKRELEHWYGKKSNPHLQNSIEKYGKENFKYEVLIYLIPEFLLKIEQYYLDKYSKDLGWDMLYNINPIAGSSLGYRHSDETKKKMSIAAKGAVRNPVTEETRKKLSEARKGRTLTPAQKEKLSTTRKGKDNPFYGKTHTEEHKRKISKEGNPMFNKNHKDESKEKMSLAKKGKPWSEARRLAQKRRVI